MVAAATLGGGREKEAPDTTTCDTMMTAVVDGEPVATRKLTKKSKASKPDANDGKMLQRLLRSLVFDKAMALYRFSMQKSQSSAVGGGRKLLEIPDGYEEHVCNGCLALFEKGQPYSLDTDQQRENFCLGVVDLVTTKKEVCMNTDLNVKSTKSQLMCQTYRDFLTNYCSELMQCPFGILVTPTVECCQFNGLCLNK